MLGRTLEGVVDVSRTFNDIFKRDVALDVALGDLCTVQCLLYIFLLGNDPYLQHSTIKTHLDEFGESWANLRPAGLLFVFAGVYCANTCLLA